MPPAILKAGSVMPNSLKIRLPVEAKTAKTRRQVQAACFAICRFRSSLPREPMAINAGSDAIGSTVRNTELSENSENRMTSPAVGH